MKYFFIVCLLLATIMSFYIFVNVLFLKDPQFKDIFSTWQFPMLLAITVDAIVGNTLKNTPLVTT